MVGGGVVHDEVGDDADAALVRLLDEALEVVDRAVVGVDREEVGDVVAAVAERRLVHRQQPDAVDAEPLEVVELLDQPAEVAGAVVVPVEEPADVDLVEDRGLEPERVRARTSGPGSRSCRARLPAVQDSGGGRPVRGRLWTWRLPGSGGSTGSRTLHDVALAGLEADEVAADRPAVALAARADPHGERRRQAERRRDDRDALVRRRTDRRSRSRRCRRPSRTRRGARSRSRASARLSTRCSAGFRAPDLVQPPHQRQQRPVERPLPSPRTSPSRGTPRCPRCTGTFSKCS